MLQISLMQRLEPNHQPGRETNFSLHVPLPQGPLATKKDHFITYTFKQQDESKSPRSLQNWGPHHSLPLPSINQQH